MARIRALRARLGSLLQHAGQPHHTGALHPLVAGSIRAPAGGCDVREPKRSAVPRAVASRDDANDTALRPKPLRKQRPGSRHSTISSAWCSRRHSRTTSGTQGVAGRLPKNRGTNLVGPHPRRRPPHAPRTHRAEVVATRGWQQTRKTGPRSRREPGDDRWPARNRPWCPPERRRPWFMADPLPGRACARAGPCYANTMLPKNGTDVQAGAGGDGPPDRLAEAIPLLNGLATSGSDTMVHPARSQLGFPHASAVLPAALLYFRDALCRRGGRIVVTCHPRNRSRTLPTGRTCR